MIVLSIIAGLFLLIKGGDWLMKSSVALSLNLNIPKMVIGMTVVSLATSAPELIISIQAALSGHSDIALGNVIGSNIANISLVLAVVLLITPIEVNQSFYKSDWPMMMFSSILFALMISYDFELSSFEGFILLNGLFLFLFLLIRRKNNDNKEIAPSNFKTLSNKKIIIYLVLGGGSLWLGSDLLINGSVTLAKNLGISERIIAITVVSIGTSIPELTASLVGIIKNEKGISLGNLIGSNIFNIMAVMGITSIIQPIKVLESDIIYNDIIWMLIISFLLLPLIFIKPKMTLGRSTGIILLSIYILFMVKLFI